MNKTNFLKFVVSLLIPLSVGAIAGMFTAQAVPVWYESLNRPSFGPPNWIFGPVWTSLYILLGFSFFLIWKENPSKERNVAIIAFSIQMLLNFAWSFIFFYFKMIGFAFVEIILLWFCIVSMLYLFYKVKPLSAYLNIPYLLWVSFASVLNGAYYFLN